MTGSFRSIGEVIDREGGLVQTGPFGSQLHSSDYSHDGGITLVMPKDMVDGRINHDSAARVKESKAIELSRHSCRVGDIVVARRGEIGRSALVRKDDEPLLCGTGCIRLSVNNTSLDPVFLYYYLCSDAGRAELESRTVGATMANLSAGAVRHVLVPTLPLKVQRKIAGILSAYDALIDTNVRRIKVLEEMAQRIYREWFVNFRYPGHEDVPFVASEVGAIPVNWRIAPLSRICDRMQAGGTPLRRNTAYWVPGTIDWYKTNELWDNFLYEAEERVTQRAVDAAKTRVVPSGTLLMAIYGAPTVGRIGILTKPGACNQAALALSADQKLISQILLYFMLMELRGHFNAIAQGAAQQNISKEKVGNTIVAYPPTALSERFTEAVQPLWEGRRVLGEAVRKLRAARDLLLPRLISGEIDVEDLDIVVDDAA